MTLLPRRKEADDKRFDGFRPPWRCLQWAFLPPCTRARRKKRGEDTKLLDLIVNLGMNWADTTGSLNL